MSTFLRTGLPLGAFLACALAGWMSPDGGAATASENTTAPGRSAKHSQRERRTAGRAGVPEEVRRLLASVRAGSTPVDRMRATLELANTLPVSELEKWYVGEWFDEFQGEMAANLFYRVTRARWLAEDPAGLVACFLRLNNTETYEVAGLWAKTDPEAALAFLEKTRKGEDRERLMSSMLTAFGEADPAFAISRMMKLNELTSQDRSWALQGLIAKLARTAPDLMAREKEGWPSHLQLMAEAQLEKGEMARNFSGGIQRLSEAADGKQQFLKMMNNDSELMKKLVANGGDLPPGWFAEAVLANTGYAFEEDPGKWLDSDLRAMGFDEAQAKMVRTEAIQVLSRKEPERALEMLLAEEAGIDRLSCLQGAFSNLAYKDKAAAREWLAKLSDPEEIAMAKSFVEREEQSIQGSKQPTAERWQEKLGALAEEGGSESDYLLAQDTRRWGSEQAELAREAFRELPAEQKDAVAARLAKSPYAQIDPGLRGEAVAYLLANPTAGNAGTGEKAMVSWASQLAASWGDEDPLAAGRWVQNLPEGEARLSAAKNLAAKWAESEPAGARRWAAGLPAGDRTAVEQYLKGDSKGN